MPLPDGLLDRGRSGIYLRVHAQPGARRVGLRGLHGNAVKIAVREAAESGKANRAVITLVAEALGVPERSVSLCSGHRARAKRLAVAGDGDRLEARLLAWLDAGEG